MGFGSYQAGDWNAKDFYTGTDKIGLSLANVGRTILEGMQLNKENKLKDEQMALAKKREANATNDRMIDRQATKENREQVQANAEKSFTREATWREEDIERNKALAAKQLEREDALIKATQANTAATYYQMKHADTLEKKTQILGNLFTAAQTAGGKMIDTIRSNAPQLEIGVDGKYTGVVTGGMFRDNEKNREWESLVRYNNIPPSQLPAFLQQFANKYKGVDQLFDPGFLARFNQAADDYNVKNNLHNAASNWNGKGKLVVGESPNAVGSFLKLQLTDEAIDSNLKKMNDSDPRWKAFEAMHPEEAKNVRMKAAFSDLLNKTTNPILYDKALYTKMKAMASQLFAGEKKPVPSGKKPVKESLASEYLQSLLSANPFYKYNK